MDDANRTDRDDCAPANMAAPAPHWKFGPCWCEAGPPAEAQPHERRCVELREKLARMWGASELERARAIEWIDVLGESTGIAYPCPSGHIHVAEDLQPQTMDCLRGFLLCENRPWPPEIRVDGGRVFWAPRRDGRPSVPASQFCAGAPLLEDEIGGEVLAP